MTRKADDYTYYAKWSSDNCEYIGLCDEFPSLSWLAWHAADAENGIREIVAEVLRDMAETGETPPDPKGAS